MDRTKNIPEKSYDAQRWGMRPCCALVVWDLSGLESPWSCILSVHCKFFSKKKDLG
jgi:hypothetical protein